MTELFKDRLFDALKPIAPAPAPPPTFAAPAMNCNADYKIQVLWRETGSQFRDLNDTISNIKVWSLDEIELIVLHYNDEKVFANVMNVLLQLFGAVDLPVFSNAAITNLKWVKSRNLSLEGGRLFTPKQTEAESPEAQNIVNSSRAHIIQYTKFKLDTYSEKEALLSNLLKVKGEYHKLCSGSNARPAPAPVQKPSPAPHVYQNEWCHWPKNGDNPIEELDPNIIPKLQDKLIRSRSTNFIAKCTDKTQRKFPEQQRCLKNHDIKNGTFVAVGPTIITSSDEECRQECENMSRCTAWAQKQSQPTYCYRSQQHEPINFEPKSDRSTGHVDCTH